MMKEPKAILIIGSFTIFKMNVLPKINYLFQMVPIGISERILPKWQETVTKFIWRRKKNQNQTKNSMGLQKERWSHSPKFQIAS